VRDTNFITVGGADNLITVCGADSPITVYGANRNAAVCGADNPIVLCGTDSPITFCGADHFTVRDADNSITVGLNDAAEGHAPGLPSREICPARPRLTGGSEACAAA
jgi:hypothetical protein